MTSVYIYNWNYHQFRRKLNWATSVFLSLIHLIDELIVDASISTVKYPICTKLTPHTGAKSVFRRSKMKYSEFNSTSITWLRELIRLLNIYVSFVFFAGNAFGYNILNIKSISSHPIIYQASHYNNILTHYPVLEAQMIDFQKEEINSLIKLYSSYFYESGNYTSAAVNTLAEILLERRTLEAGQRRSEGSQLKWNYQVPLPGIVAKRGDVACYQAKYTAFQQNLRHPLHKIP